VEEEINIAEMMQRKWKPENFDHIAKYIKTYKNEEYVYFVMERCGEDLYAYLERERYLSEGEAALVTKDIADALKILNEHKIIHRNIKLEAILLKCTGDLSKGVKLAGFRLAKELVNGETSTPRVGPEGQIAPEIRKEGPYNAKADVWQLGAVAFDMMAGVGHRYTCKKDGEDVTCHTNLDDLKKQFEITGRELSDEALQFLLETLDYEDVWNRLGIDEIAELAWIKSATPTTRRRLCPPSERRFKTKYRRLVVMERLLDEIRAAQRN